ncbi:hypothetical protein BC835DRAFT_1309459 [Cytidiella melzeri]|nr:hypothetical protein BC835DRAFT_1309459 [Cytidiella melzeri]
MQSELRLLVALLSCHCDEEVESYTQSKLQLPATWTPVNEELLIFWAFKGPPLSLSMAFICNCGKQVGLESALTQHKKKCPTIFCQSQESLQNAWRAVKLEETHRSEAREQKRPQKWSTRRTKERNTKLHTSCKHLISALVNGTKVALPTWHTFNPLPPPLISCRPENFQVFHLNETGCLLCPYMLDRQNPSVQSGLKSCKYAKYNISPEHFPQFLWADHMDPKLDADFVIGFCQSDLKLSTGAPVGLPAPVPAVLMYCSGPNCQAVVTVKL